MNFSDLKHTERLVLDKKTSDATCKEFAYQRFSCQAMQQLNLKLKASYGCSQSVITSSGTEAIFSVANGLNLYHNTPINFILSDQLYSQSYAVFLTCCVDYFPASTVVEVDIMDVEKVKAALDATKINVLFLESCSNALGKIFDFTAIAELRNMCPSLQVIVDNTWLTEIIFNPFSYGADFVVLSLTKHYSAGNCIAGALLSNDEAVTSKILHQRKMMGCHVNPFSCEIVLTNIHDLRSRIQRASELTVYTLKYFTENKHPNMTGMIHPYLENHKAHALFEKYFLEHLAPSVFLITIPKVLITKTKLYKALRKCIIFELKTSFGHERSRFDQYLFSLEETLCVRVSLGYNDQPENVISGIHELLNQF